MGKTTTACKFPKPLLLATERGYSAIPGVKALPINSWGEIKQAVGQLKTKEAKESFVSVVLDTVDIAVDLCVKYTCADKGVSNIGDIPFGQGYAMVAKEFDETLRRIAQLGYSLIMISHSTDKVFTDESGVEYNKIVPTLDKKAVNIVSRMADINGYSRAVQNEEGQEITKLFMRGTTRYMAGLAF